MNARDHVVDLIQLAAVVAAAVSVGLVVAAGAAMLGHEYLVRTVGEEGIPAVDDTPLMLALVTGTYLAGGIAALLVLIIGWSRVLRRRR